MSLSIRLCQGKELEGKAITKLNSKTIESSFPIFNGQGITCCQCVNQDLLIAG